MPVETTEAPADQATTSFFTSLRSSAAARDTLWVLAAQALATLIALAVDSLLFHQLRVPERGMLTAALALQAVLLLFCDLGISLTTVRVGAEYFAKGMQAEANEVFRRALWTRLLLVCGIAALAFFLTPALLRFPLAAGRRPELVWAGAAALLGISLLSWGVDVAQSRRRFGLYFAQQVLAAGVRAWLIVVVLKRVTADFSETEAATAEIVLWCIAGASTLAALVCVVLQRDAVQVPATLSDEARQAVAAKLHTFARYAAATVLLAGVGNYVEIFLLQKFLKAENTAIFDGARRLAMVLPLLTTALTTVLLPRAAALDSVESCAAYVRKALKFTLPMAVLASGGLAFAASFVVPLFWGDRYTESIPALRWLCLAYAFNILLNPLTLVLYPLKREGTVVLLNAISLVLSIIVGCLLIPKFGAMGAAWSVLAVKAVIMLTCAVVLYSLLRSRSNPPLQAP